eukprot:6193533-Pleurochrysis_carterae.AAC.1
MPLSLNASWWPFKCGCVSAHACQALGGKSKKSSVVGGSKALEESTLLPKAWAATPSHGAVLLTSGIRAEAWTRTYGRRNLFCVPCCGASGVLACS